MMTERQVTGVKVNPSSPKNTQQHATACVLALVATGVVGFLGFIALLSSDRKNEEAGYRMLQVAKVTGDIAKTVCRC